MKQNETKNMQNKEYKYICNVCDYKCCKQSEYNKHLSTAKHKNLTNPNKKSPKNI